MSPIPGSWPNLDNRASVLGNDLGRSKELEAISMWVAMLVAGEELGLSDGGRLMRLLRSSDSGKEPVEEEVAFKRKDRRSDLETARSELTLGSPCSFGPALMRLLPTPVSGRELVRKSGRCDTPFSATLSIDDDL